MGLQMLQQRAFVGRGLTPIKVATPVNLRMSRTSVRPSAEAPNTPPTPPPSPAADKSVVAKAAETVGLPTEDGFLGFTPFAEVWTGRWAMLGFVSSIVVEFFTGRPTLQQIGIVTPSAEVLFALIAFFGTATIIASARTTQQLLSKQMSKREINRYRSFLGLIKEEEADKEAGAMKARGDFTTPNNDLRAIAAARAAGMPADRVLGGPQGERPVATLEREVDVAPGMLEEEERSRPNPALVQPKARDQEELMFSSGEARYARDVEVANGRAAMVGFLAAILVEAGTGQGIIGQCIGYLKLVGLLGPLSGF